jgi:2-polyprenyl-3-methyl-5-hydroxy-6-metoxy-1,4-benzoquinol methylase
MGLPRHRTAELMDDPGLDPVQHADALRGLARLNRAASVDRLIWREMTGMAHQAAAQGRPLRVLDVATGSGDLPVALARHAAREGNVLDLHACDISPYALVCAQVAAREAGVQLQVSVCDVVSTPLPGSFDVVYCGLFLHHFDPPNVELILTRMAAVAQMVIVQDLRRSRLGLALAWTASRLFTRSKVVHTDAVLSVRGAFTMDEMQDMARNAGLTGATVRAIRPERQVLVWHRRA